MGKWAPGVGNYSSISFSSELLDEFALSGARGPGLMRIFFKLISHGKYNRARKAISIFPDDRKDLATKCGISLGVLKKYLSELTVLGYLIKLDMRTYRINSKNIKINYE